MDSVDALEVILELINTRPLGRRPDALENLRYLSPQLLELALGHRTQLPLAAQASRSAAEVRQLRDALAAAVLASSPSRTDRALQELMDAGPLETTPGTRPGPLAAELAWALIPLLHQAAAEGALEGIMVCPEPACQTVFLNRNRQQRRRYCSPRCGTRARMSRYRARNTT